MIFFLFQQLINEFTLPASRMYTDMQREEAADTQTKIHRSATDMPSSDPPPVRIRLPLIRIPPVRIPPLSQVRIRPSPVRIRPPSPVRIPRAAEFGDESAASSSQVQMHRSKSQLASMPKGGCIPVCGTPRSTMAAYELLSTLTLGCPANLNQLVDLLTEMFYEGTKLNLRCY